MNHLFEIPPFESLPLLKGGHRQTLAAFLWSGASHGRTGRRHTLKLPDGDELILHDDCPANWRPSAPVVLLLHGLAGSYLSAYMIRIATKLRALGVRTFRLDHRGCGAGSDLAQRPYHAGRSDDVFEALSFIHQQCRGSLLGIVGFSLSGNMLLKMLGESEYRSILPRELACSVAVNPPIDLEASAQRLEARENRRYDRHFVKLLVNDVARRLRLHPTAPRPLYQSAPSTLRVFDDQYTARVSGFAGVDDYYAKCSARHFIPTIAVPTLILTASDDPLVPSAAFETLDGPSAVTVHIAAGGGHLGYLARRHRDPDCRWMDWRVIDWLSAHLRP